MYIWQTFVNRDAASLQGVNHPVIKSSNQQQPEALHIRAVALPTLLNVDANTQINTSIMNVCKYMLTFTLALELRSKISKLKRCVLPNYETDALFMNCNEAAVYDTSHCTSHITP